jgi:hypothetical protein
MKKLLLLIGLFFAATSMQAQLLKLGARAGVNTSSIAPNDLKLWENGAWQQLSAKAQGATAGVHVGLFAHINVPLLPLVVAPELLYTTTNTQFAVQDVFNGNGGTVIRNQQFSRLDFPVMLAYEIGPLRLQAGPIGSIQLSDNLGLASAFGESAALLSNDNARTVSWGYQAGVGATFFKRLALDVKYENNLQGWKNNYQVGNQTFQFDNRPSQMLVSLGYFF